MKKEYCKYCGLELENGLCTCKEFTKANSKPTSKTKNENTKTIKCDTCKRVIDEDSRFCPYCGIPLFVNGNNKELQKELQGKYAKDVLAEYSKNGKKKFKISLATILSSTFVIFIMAGIIFGYFLYPMIRSELAKKKLAQNVMESVEGFETYENIPTFESSEKEREQQVIELTDTWVRQDGFFYCFDKNGDPVVDDWVTEVDEDGNEQKYYFDIDGKLVVNSWIDGEFYVGSDGAMLRDQETPDGAYVDEDGHVLLKGGAEVAVTQETYVYYEGPNSSETIAPSNQKSNISGEIKGVHSDRTYPLYVKKLIMMKDTLTKGDLKCNITYYRPVIDGADEREVNLANSLFEESCNTEYKNLIKGLASLYPQLPKSIVFNTIEQRNVTTQRMTIIAHGKIIPRTGLSEKYKIRFTFDRKQRKLMVINITE